MWRTVGFLASFTTLLCLGGLVTFVVIMSGGKYKRETGWPFAAAMLTLVSVIEFVAISIVVSTKVQIHVDTLFNHCLRLIFTITTTSLLFLDGIWILLFTSAPLEPPSVCYLLLVLHSPHTYFPQRKDTISSRTLLMLRRCLLATNDLALYAYVHSLINTH